MSDHHEGGCDSEGFEPENEGAEDGEEPERQAMSFQQVDEEDCYLLKSGEAEVVEDDEDGRYAPLSDSVGDGDAPPHHAGEDEPPERAGAGSEDDVTVRRRRRRSSSASSLSSPSEGGEVAVSSARKRKRIIRVRRSRSSSSSSNNSITNDAQERTDQK